MKFLFAQFLIVIILSSEVYADGDNVDAHPTSQPHHWKAPVQMTERINPVKKTPESIYRGKELYEKKCVSCHGPAGRGDGPVASALKQKPADLTAMAGHHPDGDFAWKIAEGRGAMPGWKETLTGEQIWDLVNFIQNLEKKGTDKDSLNKMKH